MVIKSRSETLYVTSIEESYRLLAYFWCPGCEESHNYWVQNPECPPAQTTLWTWNGDVESPTFDPSLLLHPHPRIIDGSLEGDALTAPENVGTSFRCHLYVTDGQIRFLDDCTHPLAGQTVPMVPLPEFMRDGRFVDDED